MGYLEFLRKVGFWGIDAIKGGAIRKHYNEIEFVQENYSQKKARDIRTINLSNIIEHAYKTVPFYENFKENQCALDDFPVIDKNLIRENFSLFKSKEYSNKSNHIVQTSGSTGIPFAIAHDKNKRHRNTADTIYFSKRVGYDLGSKLFYLRLWDKQYGKSKLLSLMQNISKYSVDDLTDDNISKFIDELEHSKSANILAYTSSLDSVCKFLDKRNSRPLSCNITSVIGMAEELNESVRKSVKKYFGVYPISRYSNSENGIFAQQMTGLRERYFELNSSSYHVEILDLNNDIPVENGESGRIVITDLFNYCMPMIRYDTGDVGRMSYHPDGKDKPMVFTKIEGRKMDMFTNTKGEYLSSHIIHHILQYDHIDQFQFIEEDNGKYIIKLKVTDSFDYSEEKSLIEIYKAYFGSDAEIIVEYVNNIPLLLSGKRKLVINNAIKRNSTKSSTTDEKVLN